MIGILPSFPLENARRIHPWKWLNPAYRSLGLNRIGLEQDHNKKKAPRQFSFKLLRDFDFSPLSPQISSKNTKISTPAKKIL